MEGWVDLGVGYTKMVYLFAVTHPRSNHLIGAEPMTIWLWVRHHTKPPSRHDSMYLVEGVVHKQAIDIWIDLLYFSATLGRKCVSAAGQHSYCVVHGLFLLGCSLICFLEVLCGSVQELVPRAVLLYFSAALGRKCISAASQCSYCVVYGLFSRGCTLNSINVSVTIISEDISIFPLFRNSCHFWHMATSCPFRT